MSELKRTISGMIQQQVEGKAYNFRGIIRDYDSKTRECKVEVSNPTGAGIIILENRLLPMEPPGVVASETKVGTHVMMCAPQGNYTYAFIVATLPPEMNYQQENKDRNVKRSSTTPAQVSK